MNYLCIVVEKYFKVKYFEFSTVGITKGYLDKQMRDNIAQIFSLTSISLQINAALFPLPSATVLIQIKKKPPCNGCLLLIRVEPATEALV